MSAPEKVTSPLDFQQRDVGEGEMGFKVLEAIPCVVHSYHGVSKHHKLCDIAEVPPPEIKELLKNLIACPNHEKEEVVYLCKDHDMTCCNKCAMSDHRKCEEVKALSNVLNDIKVDCAGLKTFNSKVSVY
ncbi:hypothetical protein DPMN_156478 [Dreissena polymorpha]|uniref:B box-type domain-containing protein n=1 Tax=Dreissena polymorpha TaxID=45954 RepID=A0A9D4FP38_DREPO|nr:hypothetical protein DPMN_156478 [Dreissena polymorpha]